MLVLGVAADLAHVLALALVVEVGEASVVELQVGAAELADALFNGLEVDGFFMEWDDARSGGFEPLRFVPEGRTVVLGLVTTKRGALEDRDVLLRRIEEASQYVDVDQLCLSPQCGFSSTVEGNALSQEQQAAKLRRVVEVAEEVWGSV